MGGSEIDEFSGSCKRNWKDVRHEDIPETNNPKIRFPVLEGDKLMKEVLNGGYNVHPVPPPNSEIKERISHNRTAQIITSQIKPGRTALVRSVYASVRLLVISKIMSGKCMEG